MLNVMGFLQASLDTKSGDLGEGSCDGRRKCNQACIAEPMIKLVVGPVLPDINIEQSVM